LHRARFRFWEKLFQLCRQKTRAPYLFKKLCSNLLGGHTVREMGHVRSIRANPDGRELRVSIRCNPLGNTSSGEKVVALGFAIFFLSRRSEKERHSLFHCGEAVGLYRFITASGQIKLRSRRRLSHVGFTQDGAFIFYSLSASHFCSLVSDLPFESKHGSTSVVRLVPRRSGPQTRPLSPRWVCTKDSSLACFVRRHTMSLVSRVNFLSRRLTRSGTTIGGCHGAAD
jgi:hypothetical protein